MFYLLGRVELCIYFKLKTITFIQIKSWYYCIVLSSQWNHSFVIVLMLLVNHLDRLLADYFVMQLLIHTVYELVAIFYLRSYLEIT